ncbi:LysR family transcriptional regulator [Paenibacillus alkalitolerans]|uniref:LysR family transcriptional regulator n=1 Tax=Paenibacillus alkalitolerans TaxID=2799335 RepID=UPI0018F593F9|nr:LysR family transcriptional regulator [Paenibacillus alkalitolerans]
MESGDLRIFQAVAREGSITKAASRLGYVQSNVTARIQQLELELQRPLFHRSKRGMTLTSAGQNLLEHADKILYLLDAAQKQMINNDIPNGSIKLGSVETAAAVYLPSIMLNYRKQYPEVKLSLFSGYTNELVQKVIRYELDGAFVNGPIQHPELDQFPVFQEEIVLISEPGSGDLTQVLNKPLLFFGVGCYVRERFESWLKEEGIPVPEIMEFGTLEAIIGGVAAGLGTSILPRSTVRKWEAEGALRVHDIPKKYSRATVYFIYRRDHFFTCAFTKFVEQIKNVIAEASRC